MPLGACKTASDVSWNIEEIRIAFPAIVNLLCWTNVGEEQARVEQNIDI